MKKANFYKSQLLYIRRNYAKTKNAIKLGNLLEIQKKSYDWFLTTGIKEVFEDIFPVESFTGNLKIELGEYLFENSRYSIKECKERYATYAAPLKVQARLFNQETGEVKEQEIFLGDMHKRLLQMTTDVIGF